MQAKQRLAHDGTLRPQLRTEAGGALVATTRLRGGFRGTWVVVLALFAFGCTLGGPHPEPPSPQPAVGAVDAGPGGDADGGRGSDSEAPPAAHAGSGATGGNASGADSGVDGGAVGEPPSDACVPLCDEDAGATH